MADDAVDEFDFVNTDTMLDEIRKFSKTKLKRTQTKISYSNGKQFIKEGLDGEEKEILGSNDEENSNDSASNPTQTENETNTIYWSKNCGFLVDLVPDLSIHEIIPRLYLSGDDAACNRDILESKNITHVLNLTTNVPNKFEPNIKYMKYVIYDLPNQDVVNMFNESFKFIDETLSSNEHNSVLVHCNAGVSRSPTFIIAYLLQKRMFTTFRDAFDYVKSKRAIINPNFGFIMQLLQLEKEIFTNNNQSLLSNHEQK
jgi:protein-tyrosine phosphatase